MMRELTKWFNWFYGCGTCLSRGKSVKTSVNGTMLSFPYDVHYSDGHTTNRSHLETLKNAKVAEERSLTQLGVKGFSMLFQVPGFDIIRGVTIDYLHCVLLGVQRCYCNSFP